jgi:hypothetical protein
MIDRRRFLVGTMGAAYLASRSADSLAQTGAVPAARSWDSGRVRHLLPTVNDSQILVKASFTEPLRAAPTLRAGTVAGRSTMTDTAGECWQFHLAGLASGQRHTLSLTGADGRALCQPWELSTFPPPDARPERVRILFFTCAGGPEGQGLRADGTVSGNLPTALRNRLLRRGLSFAPDAAVANGDHVYWDLHAPRTPLAQRNTQRLDSFTRDALVFGTTNEAVLKRAAAPQIVPTYGCDFRSTPVFFLQDDHDYFDNDEGTDEIVTFPPPWFQLQLARATQRMYYPEFLPDAARPANLPWTGSADRGPDLSESYGTLRIGRMLEVLLYDVRRTMTLAGPSATFIEPEVERWLLTRTASSDVTHLVHGPSNPMGWSAGKWGEWYPDVLDGNGRLTAAIAKPYWQRGWLAQHDRLLRGLTSVERRTPLVVSGDLHAVGMGHIRRSGTLDMQRNPVVSVLSGPLGTAPAGWISAFRGIGATIPAHLDVQEDVKPIEQHSFTIIDFLPDKMIVRLFKWDLKTQPPEAIDTLQPFHTQELAR